MKLFKILIMMILAVNATAQMPVPPPVICGFKSLTSYEQLSEYLTLLDDHSDLVTLEAIGQSIQARNLYTLKYSTSGFGKDPSRIRVLIFAQQHGNEQSGKEAALLLAGWLLRPENRYLFNQLDLALIPQVNPDGAALNQRRNAGNMDLNRNHLILTEPETRALHRFFDRHNFEMTLDVHEYSPYGSSWRKYGYRKNAEVTLGTLTNINISTEIRNLADKGYLPFFLKYTRERGFSSFVYCPGGPPGENYIRHSTFDVNDGRQSLGIQHTFSFIQEGMNGIDDSTENLQRRAEGQLAGMQAFVLYAYEHAGEIRQLVGVERDRLLRPGRGEKISIQNEHIADGTLLELPLFSYSTGADTTVIVPDYRPVVKSLSEVTKPAGYLIPKDCAILAEWITRHGFKTGKLTETAGLTISRYHVIRIDSIDFEGDIVVDPVVEVRPVSAERNTATIKPESPVESGSQEEITRHDSTGRHLAPGSAQKGCEPSNPAESNTEQTVSMADYVFIPVDQPKGNLLILALEPKSMLGLVTYPPFAHLLKPGEPFVVLRVEKK